MGWESLIRWVKSRGADGVFAGLFLAALALGGGAALAGVPQFLDALLPSMAAEARPGDPPVPVARLALAEFAASAFAPQLLYPVASNPLPAWLTARSASDRHPVIAICIDDLGEDIAGTDKAMALPRAVALSFLPFAETTPFLAAEGRAKGHEVLGHIPMQAVSSIDPGPMTLKAGMDDSQISRNLAWDIARVPGLIGINNHEGSRFTADAAGLAPVMAMLKARGLFFFDSRTGPDSKVAAVAAAMGVTSAGRDIFLDDDQSETAVKAQLAELAAVARRQGVAIAIGHPHAVTLRLLAAWLGENHGVTLVPLSEAMRMKAELGNIVAMR